MTEDILEIAKNHINHFDSVEASIIEKLTAEVERMRSENNRINKLREAEINQAGAAERVYLEAMMVKDARIKDLESEITAWIADRDSWIARYEAVREEKDARIADQEAYIERLEAAFLKLYVNELVGCNMPREVAEKHARDALEGIKEGGKDE